MPHNSLVIMFCIVWHHLHSLCLQLVFFIFILSVLLKQSTCCKLHEILSFSFKDYTFFLLIFIQGFSALICNTKPYFFVIILMFF